MTFGRIKSPFAGCSKSATRQRRDKASRSCPEPKLLMTRSKYLSFFGGKTESSSFFSPWEGLPLLGFKTSLCFSFFFSLARFDAPPSFAPFREEREGKKKEDFSPSQCPLDLGFFSPSSSALPFPFLPFG